MTYVPNEHTSLETVEQLAYYLREELRAISRELSETTTLELRTRYVAPERPRDGMIVSADGTSWNPGAGVGIYAYLGGVWTKLS